MTVTDFINTILDELGEPKDGSGFWTRKDVLNAISFIQRAISEECENILATVSATPAASDETITVDSNGNLIHIVTAYRIYNSDTKPIFVYTEDQIYDYDWQWKTRTGSLVRGLITDIADEGKARLYPIPDNADNTITVRYIKLADELSSESGANIEIPAADIQTLKYGVKGTLLRMEADGKNLSKSDYFLNLYEIGKASVRRRVRKKRKGTYGVIKNRSNLQHGIRTRPFYPWEV